MENQEQKTKKKSVVIPILIIVGSILAAYFMSGVGPAPVEYEVDKNILKKIDSLEKVNNQLVIENLKLDSLLEEYRFRTDDLDWRLNEMMKRRNEAQLRHTDISNAARTEDAEATQEFFKQRYNF
jgi:hypothetical protein